MTQQAAAELERYTTFAVEVAREAGTVSTRYYRTGVSVETKADDSPVTVADRETERAMRALISARFPDHGILGEEAGLERPDSPWRWIIDPIDGTKSFIHGVPLYTQLIALAHDGVPLVGVIHNPILEETVWAFTGGGCFYNGNPTRVRTGVALSAAWVQTCDPADLAQRKPDFTTALLSRIGAMRTWADAHGYLLVATGRADACLDPVMSAWDIAPLYPIIEEAGGVATSFAGTREPLGDNLIAASPEVHRAILDLQND